MNERLKNVLPIDLKSEVMIGNQLLIDPVQ
jgi:hypothetical protein